MAHKVYDAIVGAIRDGRLIEPFDQADFRSSCPELGEGTYNAFLSKHARGNPGNNTELFERVSKGKYVCVRPFLYGLEQES